MKKFRLPYGVQDYLPEECYQKDLLEKALSGVFYNAGFEKVETGGLEYYDLYNGILDADGINRMFKLTDSDGSLLVLRPDITIQIGRMAATKLAKDLRKLYYIENSYEFLPDSMGASARTREFSQAGIEILGESGVNGDIETVMLAIEALLGCGLNDFLIDIGDVSFFNGILSESGLNESDAAELKRCLNRKDALGTEMLLSGKKLSAESAAALQDCNSLYGGAEVLKKAEKLAGNALSRATLDRLGRIVSALKAVGYDRYVSVDLGLLKGGYYTGLVIRGIAKDFGVSILDGGRYDNLSKAFGGDGEAVGFAIGTKRLLEALAAQGRRETLRPCDYAYINLDGFSAGEFTRIGSLRAEGLRAVKLYAKSQDELVGYCKQNGIKNAIVFSGKEAKEIKV